MDKAHLSYAPSSIDRHRDGYYIINSYIFWQDWGEHGGLRHGSSALGRLPVSGCSEETVLPGELRLTHGCALRRFRIRKRGGMQLGLHCGGVPRCSCARHEEERRVFPFRGTAAAPARSPG
ncbi:hypothetical protein NDU88_003399 [Pleurodeles waltl]|uniref:Uncharacterized protein n=1 Tax=Pleurodeles waltl TaxID=8319 RepID=A0AAV7T506_PLEWA|nr:hypothetical protein NDU88_003399 [Pleurodeles waltl]